MQPFDFPAIGGPAMTREQWEAGCADLFAPLEIRPRTRADGDRTRDGADGDRATTGPASVEPAPDFEARSIAKSAGTVHIVRIEQSPADVLRTPEMIAVRGSDLIKVSLQVDGDCTVEQGGRTAELRPGDIAIYDASRPYALRSETGMHTIVLAFPYQRLGIPRDELSRVTAVVFPFDSPLGAVVNPFLAGLARSMVQMADDDIERLAQTAIDLLVTVLSAELRRSLGDDPRRQLLHEVLETIERRLSDPELSPSAVAEEHFISTRHLHALFSERGITVAGWMRHRRLERIRRDLADPLHTSTPVARLAARHGLLNAAHFSRMFRAEFGVTPSAYRASAQRADEVSV
ncbi:helix-turn-helix domain-containing protein [Helcobacillus massiliensis]|uniref:AraC-like ligand-binding domain-containing protein n=1 Tax=Helcobacillus massiliensis TaxID=521392 RepID=UPI0021A7BA55|nr:helix-turn-helix domain-containing protein [Helcobacillus massiliensis]MCT1558527.1 helix-turn-helix domain-containing protein [Helcobacillus massiliensis]MCT2036066.1 helix-turn-helix domain-containing protein [Helcobacillus massiliensis]MCT2332766.1 helix-turn-helix domain-containing protein [Helcobacillus massiliensis]